VEVLQVVRKNIKGLKSKLRHRLADLHDLEEVSLDSSSKSSDEFSRCKSTVSFDFIFQENSQEDAEELEELRKEIKELRKELQSEFQKEDDELVCVVLLFLPLFFSFFLAGKPRGHRQLAFP
jgi:neutral trehalase